MEFRKEKKNFELSYKLIHEPGHLRRGREQQRLIFQDYSRVIVW